MKWKLVPVKPTPEMLDAVSWPGVASVDWGHMIEAAPQPPALSDERIMEIWAANSGRPVTMGKDRIIAQARAIERELLGENQ